MEVKSRRLTPTIKWLDGDGKHLTAQQKHLAVEHMMAVMVAVFKGIMKHPHLKRNIERVSFLQKDAALFQTRMSQFRSGKVDF